MYTEATFPNSFTSDHSYNLTDEVNFIDDTCKLLDAADLPEDQRLQVKHAYLRTAKKRHGSSVGFLRNYLVGLAKRDMGFGGQPLDEADRTYLEYHVRGLILERQPAIQRQHGPAAN